MKNNNVTSSKIHYYRYTWIPIKYNHEQRIRCNHYQHFKLNIKNYINIVLQLTINLLVMYLKIKYFKYNKFNNRIKSN